MPASAPPFSAKNSIPYTRRIDPQLLKNFEAKLAGTMAGANRTKIAIFGSSITAGEGSAPGGGLANAYAYSWPSILKARLTARTIPCVVSSRCGDAGNTSNSFSLASYDTRVAVGAGWTGDTVLADTVGGSLLKCTGTGVLSLTPTEAFDAADVYTIRSGGNGTINWNVDGGSNTAINTATGSGIVKTPITASQATHTINLTGVSGTSYVPLIDAYSTSVPAVCIYNMGARGRASTNEFPSSGAGTWSPENILPVIAPDLTIIEAWVNDPHLSVSTANTQAATQRAITAAKLSGDVVILTQLPAATSFATQAAQDATVAAIKDTAAANNVPVLDIYMRRMNGIFANNPSSLSSDGVVHQTGAGSVDIARFVDAVLFGRV